MEIDSESLSQAKHIIIFTINHAVQILQKLLAKLSKELSASWCAYRLLRTYFSKINVLV